ncbi:MAG: TatD family hydrolase [Methanobacteriota archaeon]
MEGSELEVQEGIESAWKLDFKPFRSFTDNHMHIDPINGGGIEAVKRFEKAGGKFLFLVCKTTKDCSIELKNEKSFGQLFDFTVNLSKQINEKTGVTSFPVLGVHPAEFAAMCKRFSVSKALEIARKAIDIAGEKISNGEAVALGEIGRPHFEVEHEILEACNELLEYAFEAAADLNCAVQLHTESITEKNFKEFRKLADSAALDPRRIIKHYSPPLIKAAEKSGIYPSLIASKENIISARKEGNRFLMESDYIDDLRRPGAVVSPKSVPKLSLQLLSTGIFTEEDLWKIHKDNIEDAYGIELL